MSIKKGDIANFVQEGDPWGLGQNLKGIATLRPEDANKRIAEIRERMRVQSSFIGKEGEEAADYFERLKAFR